MERYFFIAYDVQEKRAEQCASWIAGRLGKAVVLPQPCWALGEWRHYLEYVMSRAERIVVVLTPGFLISEVPFVRHQRRLVQQEQGAFRQEQNSLSRLLVVLAEECASLLHDESVFYSVQDWVDFRTVLHAEEACQQLLLDYLYPSQVPDQATNRM